MHSPSSAHQDHIRSLLDQRTARADIHTRFPSFSECSDSPSVYSHGAFSPRSRHAPVPSDASTLHYSPATVEPRPTLTDRERLNDPSASTLDLEDDPRHSFASQDYYDDDERTSQHSISDEDEPMTRMSYLGPKMRFHSPAPWELTEDSVAEADESGMDDLMRTLSGGSKRDRSKANRADGFMKGLGLNSRPSTSSRPSNESSRSSGKGKKSFETTSSYISPGGALHALAHASMSSTSLALPPQSPKSASRSAFSILKGRSRTGSNPGKAALRPPISTPRSPVITSTNSSPASGSVSHQHSPRRRVAPRRSSSPPSPQSASSAHEDYVHPFAHPDSFQYARNSVHHSVHPAVRAPVPIRPFHAGIISPSDSEVTITDATTSTSPSSASVITPDTSAASMTHKHNASISSSMMSGFRRKEISAPISLDHSSRRYSPPEPRIEESRHEGPGYPRKGSSGRNEYQPAPAFTLISLEQAQAQARDRSRSTTAQPVLAHAPTTSVVPFPVNPANSTDHPWNTTKRPGSPTSISSRARVRSSSAGAKAKSALSGMGIEIGRRTSQKSTDTAPWDESPHVDSPPNKTVTKKKSGFLRMFRDREKDKGAQNELIPPVPQLSEAYASPNPSMPRPPKDVKRVPVPSITPSLLARVDPVTSCSSPTSASPTTPFRDTLGVDESARLNGRSPRRATPTLSIVPPQPSLLATPFNPEVISRQRSRSTTPTRVLSAAAADDRPMGPFLTAPPMSAPPGKTDFQGLSLRPVSGAFSMHFPELVDEHAAGLAPPFSAREYDFDLDTPNSGTSGSLLSPDSGGFPSGTSSVFYEPTAIHVGDDDPSAVIKALQDQITSARKVWQTHIWELEGQVRDLKSEVEHLRATAHTTEYCDVCGRGSPHSEDSRKVTVVNRPRARTGGGGRFVSGG
ncbi:hypothetical protein JAAARDRAFT_29433 [Jaapia argillacea MUCL 33604]|uniref:Uncharacterized protein n=1 Tax=Jaapia argillacea MUCL 33604 TaxID=933084 RepID=A0A067Q8M4_9AGAM|nr:hypothetical protein JAAARDRAFT_29433 [Jaapia argillacea MUCL 33604]